MDKEFEIDAYRKGRELFLVLRGQLVLKYCQDTKARLNNLFSPQIDQVYLFLAELNFLDSAGLGVLVGTKMTAHKHRTKLSFLAPQARVEDIFRVSKLDSIFEVRGGSEAEVIRGQLQREEHLMWSDRKDSRQSAFITQDGSSGSPSADGGDGAPGGRPARGQSVGEDAVAQARRWCADAVEYIRQGNYAKALESYQQALQLEPENLSALNNMAIVYEKKPEWYPNALETWRRVLDVGQRCKDEQHVMRAQKHLDSLVKLVHAQ